MGVGKMSRETNSLIRRCTTSRLSLLAGASGLALCLVAGMASSAAAQDAGELDEVIVTAQKREQRLQDVPLSVQALGAETLERNNVNDFEGSLALLPSVSTAPLGPGTGQVYMRGIVDGGDGNFSGASPSVAVYLDDQPVTSIGRVLNVYSSDVARVEALAGPQGTLYGGSSQAGTLRIITNKPLKGEFDYRLEAGASTTHAGSESGRLEGMLNIPLGDRAALRLVGYTATQGGYIDNVAATQTFYNTVVNNAAFVEENFNTSEVAGARAALGVDLSENWSVTARVMHQSQSDQGVWDHDPEGVGDLQVRRFFPDASEDEFTQTALTVSGSVGSVDLVYAASYLDRQVDFELDYSAYALLPASYIPYYVCPSYLRTDPACGDPRIRFAGRSNYTASTHEVRLQTDPTQRFSLIAGAFYTDPEHAYNNQWHIPGIIAGRDVNSNPTGFITGADPDAYFITRQVRRDKEAALFGELTLRATDTISLTLGARAFETESTLNGIVGTVFSSTPRVNVATQQDGVVYKANLSWQPNDDLLFYATYSEGFRPGGNNRRAGLTIPATYQSDLLRNYEFGWKTSLADGSLVFNGAIFRMDWADFQLTRFDPAESLIGLTANAGNARIAGIEATIGWRPMEHLSIDGGVSLINAELTTRYPRSPLLPERAPAGTDLPFVPEFSGNLNVRYDFTLGSTDSYIQGALRYRGESFNDIVVAGRSVQAAYTVVNLSSGFQLGRYEFKVFVDNLSDERAELYRNDFDGDPRITTNRPRTIGVGVSFRR
jgi:outer membrane receptor protein involved in Fe transport